MTQPKLTSERKKNGEDNTNLKGTLASVFLVGFFIVATWVSVFFLYLNRF
jgi:hypothetical protein